MILKYNIFQISKDNSINESEDAFYPDIISNEIIIDLEQYFTFALADGASTGSMLSKYFAKILVKSFSEIEKNLDSLDFLDSFFEKAYEEWINWKNEYIKKRNEEGRPLAWYEKESIKRGAFSTLLGLKLKKNNENNLDWESIAIGDSCLFLIRNNEIIKKFPISSSSEFNSKPNLVSEFISHNIELKNYAKFLKDIAFIGDIFLLMSDALAKWFLCEVEIGNTPYETLLNLNYNDDFEKFIKELRKKLQIENDDTTIIIIKIL